MFSQSLFPYELFVKLYNWNKVELQPFGLTNCGNRLVRAVPYSRKANSKCYSIVLGGMKLFVMFKDFLHLTQSPILQFVNLTHMSALMLLQFYSRKIKKIVYLTN